MPNPSIDRMSLAIAEGDFFGDHTAASRYSISVRSIQRWRKRALEDPNLSQSVAEKKRLLLSQWQTEATKPLSVALEELARRMPLAETEADAKVIYAIAGVCKILGELKLASGLLLND